MQRRFTSLLALSALALGIPTPDTPSIKIPLPKRHPVTRATGQVDIPKFLQNLNYTLQKHRGVALKTYPGLSELSKRQSYEPLTDQDEDGEDELYYGTGTVGKQTFTFDFDTGSADTFIPGPSCGTAQGCSSTTKYNQGGKNAGNTTSVTYGSGQVSGENYFDTVTVAGLRATHQNVVSLTQASGFSTSDSNSLMGMAFQSIASSGQPPYFETLVSQRKVSTPEFSFYLGRAADGTAGGSEMTLGGRDASRFSGVVTTVPVTTQGYWQVKLDEVVVGGVGESVFTPGQAAIDTGTTLVLAPTAAAASIFARVPGAMPVPLDLTDGSAEPVLYAYPCASTPDVEIVFAGKKFAIQAEDFNFGSLTGDFATIVGDNALAAVLNDTLEYCLAGIAGEDVNEEENLYIVGDVFLKNWYSIFSYTGSGGAPSVSFAKSV